MEDAGAPLTESFMALPRLEGTASRAGRFCGTGLCQGFMALPRLEGTASTLTATGRTANGQVSWHCPALRGLQVSTCSHMLSFSSRFMALPRLEGTARIVALGGPPAVWRFHGTAPA